MSYAEAKPRVRMVWPKANSLAWRLAGWTAAGAMGIVSAVALAMYLAMITQLHSIDEQVLRKRALSVRDVMQTQASVAEWLPHEVSEDLEGPRRVYIRVIDARGHVVAETPGMSTLAAAREFPMPSRSASASAVGVSGVGQTRLRGLSLLADAPGLATPGPSTVQVAVDTSLDEALLTRFRLMLLALLAPTLFGSMVVAMIISTKFLTPLTRMAREAECINADQRGRRLSGEGAIGELAELRSAFNGVLDRLEGARERLRRYADNVAHEIRTPLNRMLLRCEIAVRGEGLSQAQREMLESQIQDCVGLNNLAQRLLFLSRAEGNRLGLEREQLALDEEIELLRNYFESAAEDAGVSLQASVERQGLKLWAERGFFQQCVGNLITNALAHCSAGASVSLKARAREGGIEVAVVDTGAGISEELMPVLFDRFSERGEKGDGRIGLGLAIAKTILELHGGAIDVQSELGAGTTVRTFWPALTIDASTVASVESVSAA